MPATAAADAHQRLDGDVGTGQWQPKAEVGDAEGGVSIDEFGVDVVGREAVDRDVDGACVATRGIALRAQQLDPGREALGIRLGRVPPVGVRDGAS